MVRVGVRVKGPCMARPPPSEETSLFCARLCARIGRSMSPVSLWSSCVGAPRKGGGGLTFPVLKGGGKAGLNGTACGFRGFLPLLGLAPS